MKVIYLERATHNSNDAVIRMQKIIDDDITKVVATDELKVLGIIIYEE